MAIALLDAAQQTLTAPVPTYQPASKGFGARVLKSFNACAKLPGS